MDENRRRNRCAHIQTKERSGEVGHAGDCYNPSIYVFGFSVVPSSRFSVSATSREEQSVASRFQRAQRSDEVDAKYGFERYNSPAERQGWLINMHPVRGCTEGNRDSLSSSCRYYV